MTPSISPRPVEYTESEISRLFDKMTGYQDSNRCWNWTASTRSGYGKIKIRGKIVSAHRMSYEVANKVSLEGRVACHKCDNPLCCNPDHIYSGDYSSNTRDMLDRGRNKSGDQRGAKNGNAKLTTDDVQTIKLMIADGDTNVAIAEDFGVTHQAISKIRTGVYWAT